jgi:hypothetical protein
MCYSVYLASETILPTIPWDDKKPAFNVREISEEDKWVAKYFSKLNIYYVGSDTCCGCNFVYSPKWTYQKDRIQEYSDKVKCVRQLVKYLSVALKKTDELELFLHWAGSTYQSPVARKEIAPKDFIGEEFPLKEGELAVIRKR